MSLVQCRGCHFSYTPGYLSRHHNNSPQCLEITQQGQEVEPELGNQPMMEAGGDVSESDSMAIERLMAEPDKVEVEDDENSMDEIEITASNCRPTADES
jgi:hypothetical protein